METLVEQVAQGEVEHMTQVEVEVETPMGRWLRGEWRVQEASQVEVD